MKKQVNIEYCVQSAQGGGTIDVHASQKHKGTKEIGQTESQVAVALSLLTLLWQRANAAALEHLNWVALFLMIFDLFLQVSDVPAQTFKSLTRLPLHSERASA